MQSTELVDVAHRTLSDGRHGILSTHSAQYAGYPFGSVVPYALDASARPLLLLSSLAVHTRNLLANAHCSLLVLEHAWEADPQAHGRLTLLCDAEPVSVEEIAINRDAFLLRHPASVDHFSMKDFSLWRMELVQLRFIAGFGHMGWMNAKAFGLPPSR
jgi:putative heme iron utilization protein